MFSFQGASSSKSAFVSLRFRQSLLRLPKTALHCAVSPLQSKPTLLGFWLVGFDCWISKRLKETSTFVAASFNLLFLWWRLAGSNRWPPACKAGALPAELNPRIVESSIHFIPFLPCVMRQPKTPYRFAVSPPQFNPASLGFELAFWFVVWNKRAFRGNATAVPTCRRHVVKSRFSSPFGFCILAMHHPLACFLLLVGQNGLEPSTSRLSVVCSSQLSYWPLWRFFSFQVHIPMYPLNWITWSFTSPRTDLRTLQESFASLKSP